MSLYNDLVPRDLKSGTLCVNNRFAYLKIPDQVVKDIFNRFKELCPNKSFVLVPIFKENSPFPDPVGAHITVASVYDCNQDPSLLERIADFEGSVFPIDCVSIKVVTPTHWKFMELVAICTVASKALKRIQQLFNLKGEHEPHFTFAVMPKSNSPVEPIAKTIPNACIGASCLRDEDINYSLLNTMFELFQTRMFQDKSGRVETLIRLMVKKSEDSLLEIFAHIKAEDIITEHLNIAIEANHKRLIVHFDHILESSSVSRPKDKFFIPDPFTKFDFISDALRYSETEYLALDALDDLKAEDVRYEHIELACLKGYLDVVNLLLSKYLEKQAICNDGREKALPIAQEKNDSPRWSGRLPVSEVFIQEKIMRMSNISQELAYLAFETSELCAADELSRLDPSKITLELIEMAYRKGFLMVGNMLKRNYQAHQESLRITFAPTAKEEEDAIEYDLDSTAEQEEDFDDFIPSDFDEVEVPLRNRKIKKQNDVTSLMIGRFDDIGVLKKVRRISRSKFEVSHVLMALKQDLVKTSDYLKKVLV